MKRKTAVIYGPVFKQIMQFLSEKPKHEIVGLGFGVPGEDEIKVKNFVSMENIEMSISSFSLDYELLFKEIQSHETKGEVLVGIFHSHPEGARLYPSQKDLHFMRYWPYPYLWLIGGVEEAHPKLRIFSLLDEKVIELPYSIKNS